METKKVIETIVIEQNECPSLKIKRDRYNDIQIIDDVTYFFIENSKATEVAKAIDPEYQELEDEKNNYLRLVNEAIKENAKLLDIIKECYGMLSTHPYPSTLLYDKIKEAIQQSKSKDNE